jgi:hypothetical protein
MSEFVKYDVKELEARYPWGKKMKDISIAGGEYEANCRLLTRCSLQFFLDHPDVAKVVAVTHTIGTEVTSFVKSHVDGTTLNQLHMCVNLGWEVFEKGWEQFVKEVTVND